MTISVVTSTVREFLRSWSGTADMLHADPPWPYNDKGIRGAVERRPGTLRSYETMSLADILDDLVLAYDVAASDAYLALWLTMPTLFDVAKAIVICEVKFPWDYIGCGDWRKTGAIGTGHHWRGEIELVSLWRKGKPKPQVRNQRNSWDAPRRGHSEKPIETLTDLATMCVPFGGHVLDLYAGESGSMARACAIAGRAYTGVEADPERAASTRRRAVHPTDE